MPAARFQKFEIVSIANSRLRDKYAGQRGTIIWCDFTACAELVYSLFLDAIGCYQAFRESDLEPTGDFNSEQSQLGYRYEISYDVVINDDDMENIEGTYRLPGHPWQVFFFSKAAVAEPKHHFGTWASGITGLEFEIPDAMILNREFVVKAMTEVFGAAAWIEVRGPDSVYLK